MTRSIASGSTRRGTGSGAASNAPGQKIKPFFQNETVTLYCGDCREIVPQIRETVNLMISDPPYSHVRPETWDCINQSDLARLLDELFAAVRTKMAENAALYVFAWPTFAGQLEYITEKHFHVLNHIVWNKQGRNGRKNGSANKHHIPGLRSFCPETERIIFAEQRGADQQYQNATHEIRIQAFRPLIDFFRNAREKSGLSGSEIQEKMFELTGKRYVFERHAFSDSQWEFPARDQFLAAATFMPLGNHASALKKSQ